MNLELLNPFSQAFPENHDSAVEASALCARFNPHGAFAGHYLAVGRLDGVVSVLDFETKGVVRWLEGHVKAVTVVRWSRNSRYLLTASRDWNAIIWDLAASSAERIHGARKQTIRFDAPVTSADLHPRNSNIIIATLHSQVEPVFVDLRKSCGGRWHLETPVFGDGSQDEEKDEDEEYETKKQDVANMARFSPKGDLIYVGTSLGNIHVWDVETKQHLWTEFTGTTSAIKHMEFNEEGNALALNSNDRCIRLMRLLSEPWKVDVEDESDDDGIPIDREGAPEVEQEVPRPPRIPYFHLQHAFQDLVEKTPWNGCRFSRSGDYIVGGAGHKGAHSLYMWDADSGGLLKILEGPKDPLEDLDWHPLRPLIASVSTLGLVHIWTTGIVENWSAYAPGFEELDENREYEEKEDEFDIEDETVVKRRKANQQDRHVDIFSIDRPKSRERSIGIDDSFEQFISIEPDDDDDEAFYPPLELLEEYEGDPSSRSPSDSTTLEVHGGGGEFGGGNISEELGIEPEPIPIIPSNVGKKRGGKRAK